MRENVPYSQILDVLTDLIDNKASGSLFVRTEDNHAITIAVDTGRISAIYYGARHGLKAISQISNISGGSYRFDPLQMDGTSHEPLATPEILNLLRNPHTLDATGPRVHSPGAGEQRITEAGKDMLCQKLKGLLARHLGPIADMVFEDTVDEAGDFCSTPELARTMIDKLSADIDDPDEAEKFKTEAYAAIRTMLKY